MSDWYRDFANSGIGSTITKQLGLPRPGVLLVDGEQETMLRRTERFTDVVALDATDPSIDRFDLTSNHGAPRSGRRDRR